MIALPGNKPIYERVDVKAEDLPKGGSVFINNTSYSGADIKIVINNYGTNETKNRLADLEKEIRTVDDEIVYATDRLQNIASKLVSGSQEGRIGTPGHANLSKIQINLEQQVQRLADARDKLNDEARKLAMMAEAAPTKVLAEAQTISISTHRDKQDVRACGSVYPKGFTRGPRSIAGSIIFTVFNQHVLYDFLGAHPSDFDSVAFTSALMDQLPPVDIILAFANEYGALSRMTIYGVEFVNEGQTMSIEDILTENVVQWVARDYDPMRAIGSMVKMDTASGKLIENIGLKASDLLHEEDYKNFKQAVDPYDRFIKRRNPFL